MKTGLALLLIFGAAVGAQLLLPATGALAQSYTIWQSPRLLKSNDSSVVIETGQPSIAAEIRGNSTGTKIVFLPLILPDDAPIESITICYENTSNNTYIYETSLVEMSMPNTNATFFFDTTDLRDIGPSCYTSTVLTTPPYRTVSGSVQCVLKVSIANVNDEIKVSAVGINIKPE